MVNGPSRAGARPERKSSQKLKRNMQQMQQRNSRCIDARFVNSDSTIAVI
jgi:hypothetical protein